jgi:hypothetical protein
MNNIKYSWKIENLLKKNTDNLEDVIYSISWTYTALDLTRNVPTSISSSISLEIPVNSEGFIPFEQLTESQVTNWIKENVNYEKLNENLMKQIEYNKNLVHAPNFPWN